MSTGAMLIVGRSPEGERQAGAGGGVVPAAWVAGDVTARPFGYVLFGLLWECA